MGPLLEERPALEEEPVEPGAVERAVAGEEHLVLGRHDHRDVVDLEEPEPPDRGEQVRLARRPAGSRPPEALGVERDAARLGEGEVDGGHPGEA